MKINNSKAQAVIIDLFIALFIFLLLVSVMLIMWNRYNFDLNEKVTQKDMWIKSYHITDLLVESPGRPSEWAQYIIEMENITTLVKSLGLADFDRILSDDKVGAFLIIANGTNYHNAKELFNIEGYDFFVQLIDASGGIVFEVGYNPALWNADRTTTLRRYVNYNDICKRCILEFSLWE